MSGSTSTRTGFNPLFTIGYTVVTQLKAGVIISSPGLNLSFNCGLVKIDNERRFADEPEFTITACLTPI